MVKYLYSLLLFFFLFTLKAQDSLEQIEKEYKSQKVSDPDYFLTVGRYAQGLFINQRKKDAFTVLLYNIDLAKKKNDYSNSAFLLCIISIHHFLDNNESASSKSINEAQKIVIKTNDFETKGYVSYTSGWLAIKKKSQVIAVKYLLDAVVFYNEAPLSKSLISRKSAVYRELASIYSEWSDFESQEKYSLKALELALQQKNPDTIFSAYMLIGRMYEKKLNDEPENQNLINLVESYYIKAITIYNSNNMIYPSDLSYVTIALSSFYLKHHPETHLSKSLEYANKAKDIALITREHNHLAAAYSLLGEIALKNNEINKAKELLDQAFLELEKSKAKNPNLELKILSNLSEIAEINNEYQEVIFYQKKYLNAFKTIFDQKKLETSKRLEAQFEKELQKKEYEKIKLIAEKKEQQIQLLNVIRIHNEQEFNNLKLTKENQSKQIELSKLETLNKLHELRLIKLESLAKNKDILNYKEKLIHNEERNKFYVLLIIFFISTILLILFLLRQRIKGMKQKEILYQLALDQEKQDNKISTLTALLNGQEKERARLARDLHDGLGGLLSATKLQLSDFRNKTTNKDKHDINNALDHIDYAIEKLRRISHNLMPDLLIKFGLEIALKEFAQRMQNSNLEIHTQFFNYNTFLPKDKELFVYRIIQELVTNAIKHAEAKNIIIQFTEDSRSYHITVEDDGKGFEIINNESSNSAGFHNIESRVEFLKGEINLHSEINQGTSIEFNFPKE